MSERKPKENKKTIDISLVDKVLNCFKESSKNSIIAPAVLARDAVDFIVEESIENGENVGIEEKEIIEKQVDEVIEYLLEQGILVLEEGIPGFGDVIVKGSNYSLSQTKH